MNQTDIVVIGAGPAGLTAAYLLSKTGKNVLVLESDEHYVGGISKTVHYKKFLFDIGGHRFFSKSADIEKLWKEILPDDMLQRKRLSKIYFRKQFFPYPLKPVQTLFRLGVFESFLCIASYIKAQIFKYSHPNNFEEWVVNKFGRRLYKLFFKTYTEKVWGIKCNEISADWAAQRIKGLNLVSAVLDGLLPKKQSKNNNKVIKSLIDTFDYPRKGPGMLWEACAKKISNMGNEIKMGETAIRYHYNEQKQRWLITYKDKNQKEEQIESIHVISSSPLRNLVTSIAPQVSDICLKAASELKYRDFITVVLIIEERDIFNDNWIYIHDPLVRVGRIQNYKSWSPDMVPDDGHCSLGLEYFCFQDDSMWSWSDDELINLGKIELEQMGLANAADVIDGCVVRQPKAYPMYDDSYSTNVAIIREELERKYSNLHLIGRNGMHKYNNQDHSMMTAMLTVKNILANQRTYDVWKVNQDAEYHESTIGSELSSGTPRSVK